MTLSTRHRDEAVADPTPYNGLIERGGDVPRINLRVLVLELRQRLTDWVVTAKNTGPRL